MNPHKPMNKKITLKGIATTFSIAYVAYSVAIGSSEFLVTSAQLSAGRDEQTIENIVARVEENYRSKTPYLLNIPRVLGREIAYWTH